MLHIIQSIPTPSHSCSPGLCLSPSLRPHRPISLKSKNLKPYLVPFTNPEPNCVPFDASETHSWSLHCFRNSLMSPLPDRKQSIVPLANLDNKIHFSKFFSHFFWQHPKSPSEIPHHPRSHLKKTSALKVYSPVPPLLSSQKSFPYLISLIPPISSRNPCKNPLLLTH